MQSRWFDATVVMLWLATMSWLVTQKVLPPLLVGEPPSYRQIVDAQESLPPVGWRLSLNDQQVGWALSDTQLQPTGLTEIFGRVHFDTAPLKKVMPGLLHALSPWIGQSVDHLELDARSVLTIDSLGHLVRFDSKVGLDPFSEAIRVRGSVEGRKLELLISTGGASVASEAYLPSDSLLSDVLSPQTSLPGLRVGQKWTVPVYSPLWLAKSPLEIIHAEVKRVEPISWNEAMEECSLVEYRNDLGLSDEGSQKPRGKLWVHRDGTVLKQEVLLFDSVIMFERMPKDEAKQLTKAAGERWWCMEIDARGIPHD
jgi:hypothetical protein